MADREGEKSGRTLRQLLDVDGDDDSRVDWAAVQQRLRSHPDEAAERDEGGCYPLLRALYHAARAGAPPPAVVRALLDAEKGAAEAIDDLGRTPLHTACFNRCGADIVGMLLKAFPEAAKMKGLGCIPLHYASSRGDAEVVRLLIREYPEGVGVRGEWGKQLPLHWAATSGYATPAIVRRLLDEGIRQGVEGGSGGASVKDNFGNTPLNFVCDIYHGDGMTDGRWEVVVALARAATSSTTGTTDDGTVDMTPLSDRVMLPTLHAVIKAGSPERIVRHAISRGNPGAALERDHCGRTALAVAATMWEPNPKVLETLLSEGSGAEAARTADNDGRLPLHLAAESGWPYENGLEALLNAEPRALVTRDAVMHMYPFMLAAVDPASNLDSAFCLLRSNPSLVGWKENEA